MAPTKVLQFRIPQKVYSELQKSAKRVGTSLANEADRHLQRSIAEKTNEDLEKMIKRAVRAGNSSQHTLAKKIAENALAASQCSFTFKFHNLHLNIVTPLGTRIVNLGDILEKAARQTDAIDDLKTVEGTLDSMQAFSRHIDTLTSALNKRRNELIQRKSFDSSEA